MKNKYIQYSRDQEISAFLAQLSPGAKILDFGCGSGVVSHFCNTQGFPTLGLDISQKLLDIAESNKAPNATFELIDANAPLPAAVSDCDAVLTYGVLCYFDDENLKKVLADFRQKLKPSAKILFVEQVVQRTKLFSEPWKIQRPQDEYINFFTQAGFKVKATSAFRWGRFPLIYLVRYGLIPVEAFAFIRKLEPYWGRTFAPLLNDYFDVGFYLEMS